MVNASNTNSPLVLPSGANVTSTALSTNIIIAVRGVGGKYVPVGAVQTMRITETRDIKMIDEVGTDGHIDSTPIKSTNIEGTCNRIRFDKLRIAEAFDRSFMHVASQVYPFDIIIVDKQKQNSAAWVTTVIKNVWIKSISYTYQTTDWTIADEMAWSAENIYSTMGSGPAAQGGQNALVAPFQMNNQNWVEVATDMGLNGRRGSLDAAGLIDIGTSNYSGVGTTSVY
jgi:hypothetical protein